MGKRPGKNGWRRIMSESSTSTYSSFGGLCASQSMMAAGLLYAAYVSLLCGFFVSEGATCVGTSESIAPLYEAASAGVQHMTRDSGPGCWLSRQEKISVTVCQSE